MIALHNNQNKGKPYCWSNDKCPYQMRMEGFECGKCPKD